MATDRTLERARAPCGSAGEPRRSICSARVHAQRGEAEQAEQAAERARALREKRGLLATAELAAVPAWGHLAEVPLADFV